MFYSNQLREIREEKELRQKELATLLNIQENAYSQYETGYVTIPIKHLIVLCDYFNVSIDYIFGFTTIRKYSKEKDNINRQLSRERLIALRKKYNLTQKELANSINVSSSTISEYERTVKTIATPFLYDICKKYNVSADYLLGKVDNPKYLK